MTSSQTLKAILIVVNENGGSIEGTEQLAYNELQYSDKAFVIRSARALSRLGCIQIIPPQHNGRGHKTVYLWNCSRSIADCKHCSRLISSKKRNRNSPGYRRQTGRGQRS